MPGELPGLRACIDSVRRRQWLRRLALAVALAAMAPAVPAKAAEVDEAALKGAFLFNFALYTEWPSLPNAYELCVAGRDDLGAALDGLTQKLIAGRPITIRRLPAGERIEVPQSCTILFVAASEKERGRRWVEVLKNRSVLTIGDVGLPSDAEPMIRLATDQGRLVFSASLSRAKAVGMSMSARMLRIAKSVD